MIQSLTWWVALLLAVPVHWALPPRLRASFVAAVSAAVLATVAPWVVLGVAAQTLVFYALLAEPARRKAAFVFVLVALLGQLAVFKYLPPLLPGVFGAEVLVPLGLSFTTFKLLHYGAERLRGTLRPHGPDRVLAWVLLFPTFTAGPIERFDHFEAEAEGRWTLASTVEGLTRVVVGLVKHFVIGQMLLGGLARGLEPAVFVERLDTLGASSAWMFVVLSFLRLYMDFSGYCDIAIGASRLFGYRVMENFDWPLMATSPADFWQRWHISLSKWCQSYVYMPMIGLTRNPWLAVYATFLVMGAWHAGSVHWLIWGLWQGTGVALTLAWRRQLRRRRWSWPEALPARALAVVGTFLFMCAAQSFTALHGVAPVGTSFRVLARLLGVG